MRTTLSATAAIVVAALVNTVPSKAALFPATARCGVNEADICGSGFEVRRDRTVHGHSNGDRQREADIGREWRALAARCRSLAEWQNDEARKVLLALADEYEARAKRAERSGEG
jgi:hypothetical protein